MFTELHPSRLSIRFCLKTNLDRSFRTINLDPRPSASERYCHTHSSWPRIGHARMLATMVKWTLSRPGTEVRAGASSHKALR